MVIALRCFRMSICFRITELWRYNCHVTWHENGANFGFFGSFVLGTLHRNRYSKFIIGDTSRGKDSGMSVFRRLRKCVEKKKHR